MTRKNKLISDMDVFTRHYIHALLFTEMDSHVAMKLSLRHAKKRYNYPDEESLKAAYDKLGNRPRYFNDTNLTDMDLDETNFTEEALEMVIHDCLWFQNDNREMLEKAYESTAYQNIYSRFSESDCYGGIQSCAGHDFWMTRQGQGVGFWDRGLPEDVDEALTGASKAFGECYVEVDDKYRIHIN